MFFPKCLNIPESSLKAWRIVCGLSSLNPQIHNRLGLSFVFPDACCRFSAQEVFIYCYISPILFGQARFKPMIGANLYIVVSTAFANRDLETNYNYLVYLNIISNCR